MALERGALLHNRYRILEILGQGGMGSVYRAVDDNLGVEVAVKENLFTTEEYSRQFRREATILAGLRHPNLPRVSDHFVIEGQGQYLVMDYIEGEDLRERLDRIGVIPEAEAVIIGVAICDALSYMHNQKPPILHRDLKPGNVKITPEGKVFLVDFGLAKAAFTDQQTTTGARAMTPGYSPPEQYGGARTDRRSDIYSLAATLYASMAGAIPEDSLARTLEQAELTPLRHRNPEITRRLSKVIEKALAVHPDDRYQTAEEFKKALLGSSSTSRRRLLEGAVLDPLPAGEKARDKQPEPPAQPDRRPPEQPAAEPLPISAPIAELDSSSAQPPRSKRRRGCSMVVLLLVAFFIVGGGVAYLLNPAMPEQIMGALPVSVSFRATETWTASPEPTATATPLPFTSTLTLTPTNSSTPKNTSTQTGTSTFTQTVEPTLTKTLPPTMTPTPAPTTAAPPTTTPTGGGYGQIAFASLRTGVPQIFIVNSDGLGLRQLTDIPLGACQPDWSPDGARLVFISPCGENQELYDTASLYIIYADGGGLEPLPTTGRGDFDPAWSPDGRRIAFTSLRNGFRPQVHLMDLETKEVHRLSMVDNRDYQPEWLWDGSKLVFITTRNGPYQVWTMNDDGSGQARFSASGGLWNTYPVFSPNGQVILYTQREQGGVPGLMAARYPDGGVAEFEVYPYPGAVPMREANYSPDGNWLVFESWPDGAIHDIYIMNPNGENLYQLTFDAADDFDPDWRPIEQ